MSEDTLNHIISGEESEGSFRRSSNFQSKPNFLEVLSGLPSLDQLSLSDDEIALQVDGKEEEEGEDEAEAVDETIGQFVDIFEEDSPEMYDNLQVDLDLDDESVVAEEESKESEFDERDELEELDKAKKDVVKKSRKVAEKAWYEAPSIGEGQKLFLSVAEREAHEILVSDTNDFLDEVITQTVETCEYEDPDDILRARLDKEKLIVELEQNLSQLDMEQKVRFFLNRKVVEHFRRKKTMRPLMDDSPDFIMSEMRKYKNNTQLLDRLLGREQSSTERLQAKLSTLREKVTEMEAKSAAHVAKLNALVRSTFLPDLPSMTVGTAKEGSKRMESLIESLLKRISHIRNEISEVRYVLIQRQHTVAMLTEKTLKLEDLGNGLRMVQYEHLETDTTALGKKIEERNNELNKLRTRCSSDTHTLAHIREKEEMLRSTIEQQTDALNELIDEQKSCREYLLELKIERGAIRREYQDLSYEGGLINNTELLLDYDATVEKVTAAQQRIAKLKLMQSSIETKMKGMSMNGAL